MKHTVSRISRLPHIVRFVAVLALALAGLPGRAGTPVERQLEAMAKTAPHLRFGPAAKPVTVHYVHLKDDYEASQTRQAELRRFKEGVTFCVEVKRRLGRAASLPAAFPDQLLRTHEFTYSTPNRAITYVMNYIVRMNDDCNLIERTDHTAKLRSSMGECVIDLDRKTAEGVCDATGHAAAAARPRAPQAGNFEAGMAALAADPLMAKHMAALRQLPRPGAGTSPQPNAQRRTIAGFECHMIEPIPGERICVSNVGSFVPAVGGGLGMTLHREFATYTSTAVEAKFDLPLDAAIFTPYLGGGYTITSKGGK